MKNLAPPEVDPDSWFALGLSVALDDPSFLDWPEAPWLGAVKTSDDESARVLAFEAAEAPFISQVDSAVDSWLRTGVRPPLADMPLYFFSLRRQVVGNLLMSLEDVRFVLPPPDRQLWPNVVRSFLVDWWRRNGSIHGTGFTLSDADQ